MARVAPAIERDRLMGAHEGVAARPRRNDDHRRHFHALNREQQADAIRGLANDGMSELGIAAATGYAVEQVRQILGAPTA